MKTKSEVPGTLGLRASTLPALGWFRPTSRGGLDHRAARITVPLWLFVAASCASGADFSAILGGIGQDYATSVTSDNQGNVYVVGLTYSSDFPVTKGAVQTTFGGTSDAFVAKIGPDGKVVWSTYLGGILDDWATGVALDGSGNVLVTGYTRSANFPLANALQTTLDEGASPDDYDAFVAKLDPNGAKLLYSTFLGGNADDGAAGIAVDSAGNAYIAVNVNSSAGFPGSQTAPGQFGIFVSKLNPLGALLYSFFHPYGNAGGITLDAADSVYVGGTAYSDNPSSAMKTFGTAGTSVAMVFKVSPDGTKKIYETTLGGSVQATGAGIAVDSAGEAYIAGSTSSVDFPLVKPLQSSPGARPLWKSTDSGTTWTPLDNLPFALPQSLVVDPTTANTLYAASGDLGIFKSMDGGASWAPAGSGIAGTNIQTLAIDPVHPQTLYAATTPAMNASSSTVYKTVNGANTWTMIDSPPFSVFQISVDAQNPNIVWEVGSSLRKSTDAGATWNPVTFPGGVQSMALDPRVSGNVFAVSSPVFCGVFCGSNTSPGFYRSVDGGTNWIQENLPEPPGRGLIVDGSTNPSTVYSGLGSKSVDGGITWIPIISPPGASSPYAGAFVVDPSGTLYAVYGNSLYISHDHAQTWMAISSFTPPTIVPAGSTGTLYASLNQASASGFVTKLSADGSSIVYSTYLRGHPSLVPSTLYSAEPDVFTTQNWISAIAVDASGNATVAGGTRGVDFPVVMPAQAADGGLADAFVTTISPDGSQMSYSTYFGGSQDDGALAATLDSQGNVIFAGQTWSGDFPVPGGPQLPFSYGNAFVVRLTPPGTPAITSVLNAASFQPGIEAGSWAMILGANLANTFPGRTWRSSEIVNGNLPTSLDGVSVTIDGKPAFVEYISPTQINVQAPSDSATGTVNVVVDNNGNSSALEPVQLQAAAPGFFMYSGTNFVIASRLPDYGLVADPSMVPGTVAAKPGDIVVLWGTGFGATNPPVPAGTAATGVPVAVTPPTVTVGGVAAQVIGAELTAGSAGLYQVTIQLPTTVPTGAVVVLASTGSAQSQPGALLFVSKP